MEQFSIWLYWCICHHFDQGYLVLQRITRSYCVKHSSNSQLLSALLTVLLSRGLVPFSARTFPWQLSQYCISNILVSLWNPRFNFTTFHSGLLGLNSGSPLTYVWPQWLFLVTEEYFTTVFFFLVSKARTMWLKLSSSPD